MHPQGHESVAGSLAIMRGIEIAPYPPDLDTDTTMPRPPRKLRVLLSDGHRRYVPRAPAGADLLGVVERGMQIGALARLPDGSFVQVNGDIMQPLNRSQVENALRCARPVRLTTARLSNSPTQTPPVVTIKRRRAFKPT